MTYPHEITLTLTKFNTSCSGSGANSEHKPEPAWEPESPRFCHQRLLTILATGVLEIGQVQQ